MKTHNTSIDSEKEIITLEKKLLKVRSEDFVADLRRMSVSEMEAKLSELSKQYQDVITASKEDVELQRLKDQVTDLQGPYNDAKKQNLLTARFVSLLLKEKAE